MPTKYSDMPSALADLVKGARKGHFLEGAEDERPLADAVDDAHEAWKSARGASIADLQKSVMPQLQPMIQAMGGSSLNVGQELLELRKVIADLTKTEFTGSYPISGSQTGFGFAVYDLQAPSKKIFPVLTPFRNRIPRVSGVGSATQFKQLTEISGSGGSLAPVNHFLAELPSNSVGGLTLNLPPEIGFTAADKSFPFKPFGLSGSNSMISQIAGRGYEDIRSLVGLSVLQSLMLSEERGLFAGRTAAVAAPTIVSAVSGAPTGAQVALTGVTTNVWTQVTAITMMGESAASATTQTATSNGNCVTVTIGTVVGAEGYRVYVGTGGADPGVAAHFKMGETGFNVFVEQGAVPTSGPSTSGLVDSTASANAYLGVLASMEAFSNPYITGTGSVPALNAAIGLNDVQGAFLDRYEQFKADIEELWTSASDRRGYTDLVLAQAGAAAQGYRIVVEDGATNVVSGVVVSAVLNESTGREVPLRVHPWLHRGNLVGLSYTLPFPNSEIPNVWEVKLPQDYLAIDWPVIDMNYRTSVIGYGALIPYAPGFNFWIKGIKSTIPSIAQQ